MPEPALDAAGEKALAAEKHISLLRLGVVALNTFVYYVAMGRPGPVHALADATTVAAVAYTVFVYFFEPYRKVPALTSSYFTAVTDAALITVWLFATGGAASPWHLLWYASILAVAFRYSLRETLMAGFIYAASYVALAAGMGQLAELGPLVLLRSGYILLMAAAGGLLARELLAQTREKLEMRELARLLEREVEDHKRARETLREAQERLQTVVSNAPIILIALDRTGRLTLCEGQGLTALRMPQNTGVGQSIFEAFPPSTEAVRRALGGEEAVEAHEAYGLWFETRWFPHRDAAGEVVGAVGVATDVTARVRAEREVEASRRQVAMREKLSALGTLVAGVAHEINNPLAFMRSSAELTRDTLLEACEDERIDPAIRRQLVEAVDGETIIIEGIDRISGITRSLKQVARAPNAARAPEDVNGLVQGVLTLANARLAKGIRVEKDLAAARHPVISGSEVSQVILNLVLNAVEAMEPGGGRLAVRTRDEGDCVVIEVEDTGRGIPLDEQHKVFTPFHTTKLQGTGLGLSVSYGIVEAHGGRLGFTTSPAGTTFRVDLPAGDRNPQADLAPSTPG